MSPLELFLSRLPPGCKVTGNGHAVRCPAHEDKHPSLSVATGVDGRLLLHCHANCSYEQIMAAVGLTPADGFIRKPRAMLRVYSAFQAVIPEWIRKSAVWYEMRAPSRWLLGLCCEACYWQIDDESSLGYFWIGDLLPNAAMSRAFVWENLHAFYKAGFIAKLSQGGCVDNFRTGKHLATFFAVQGEPGALVRLNLEWNGKSKIRPAPLIRVVVQNLETTQT